MRFTLQILGLLFALFAMGKEQALAPSPEGFRAGMEVELSPSHFAKITPLFDFEQFQEQYGRKGLTALGKDFFDNYLRGSPHALTNLPAELRAELTKGLQLESLVLKEEAKPLSVPETTKLEVKKPAFELQPSGQGQAKPRALILPGENTNPTPAGNFQAKEGLLRPARLDWETLHSRWNQLPYETKAAAAKWELLDPLRKAELGIHLSKWGQNKLLPKKDLPPATAAFLEKLSWEVDMNTMEFKHKQPVAQAQELYDDIVRFGRLAGVSSKLENSPESKIQGVSLHYHLSVRGRNLEPLADGLNDLIFLKRVKQGLVSDFLQDTFSYRNLNAKGLVRLISPDHMEIRAHPDELLTEIGSITDLLNLSEAEAKGRLDREVAKLLQDEEVFRAILKYKPPLLRKFLPMLSEEQKSAFRQSANLLPGKLRSDDPQVVKAAIRTMAHPEFVQWNDETARALIPMLTDELIATDAGLKRAEMIVENIAPQAAKLPDSLAISVLRALPAMIPLRALPFMVEINDRKNFSPAFYEELLRFLENPNMDPNLREAMEIFLREEGRNFPSDFSARLRASSRVHPALKMAHGQRPLSVSCPQAYSNF